MGYAKISNQIIFLRGSWHILNSNLAKNQSWTSISARTGSSPVLQYQYTVPVLTASSTGSAKFFPVHQYWTEGLRNLYENLKIRHVR
jgi:hypothetical protein